MTRSKILLSAFGILFSTAAVTAEPQAVGGAAGSPGLATASATKLPTTGGWIVAGAALAGTAVGLSDDSDGSNSTATSTSATSTTGTSTAR